MQIATYTDVMNNPHYALHKVNPGAIFSVAVKKLSTYLFCTKTVTLYIIACHEYIYG